MSAKKPKNLADELLDDLLDDDAVAADSFENVDVDLSRDEDEVHLDDATLALDASGNPKKQEKKPPKASTTPFENHKNKVEQQRPIQPASSYAVSQYAASATEMAFQQSEQLKIAQKRILELENDIDQLRKDHEELAVAGRTYKRKFEELSATHQIVQSKLEDEKDSFNEERKILKQNTALKDAEIIELKDRIREMESRVNADIQRIRMRERELENRLEIVKMENSALLKNKNEIILDLKRTIDQLSMEIENFRNRGKELNKKLDSKQEMLRRTVKTLRIALTMLEGDHSDLKKAD